MKRVAKIWFLISLILFYKNGICQSSLTENTADEIHIAANVEWSDWGNNYTNGNNGNVRNYGTFIFYGYKFTNNGSYISYAGSKDSFIANAIDTISGTHRASFYDVIFDNRNDVIINSDSGIGITHNLNLRSNIIFTDRSKVNIGSVNFSDNSTYTGTMSNSKFIDGYVTKTGNDAFVFPTGDASKYHSLTISAPSSSTYELSVAYYYDNAATSDLTGGNHPLTSLASPLTSVDNSQFWDVVTTGSDYISVTIQFETLVTKYLNASNVKMVGWNIADARWEVIGNNIPNGLVTGSTISNDSVNLSRYSALALGSTLEVLPIELINLSVYKIENKKSLIQWSTASEKNCNKFVIEHSSDMNTFFAIGEKFGSDNSTQILNYSFIDTKPLDAKNYYRLKQINNDGSFSYTSILTLDFTDNNINENLIKVELVNTNSQPSLFIESGIHTNLQISIYSIDGKLIQQPEMLNVQASSSQIFRINKENSEKGIYLIEIKSDGKPLTVFKIFF